MPRYSPTRQVFNIASKDIKLIPFNEVYHLYMDSATQLKRDAESIAEATYAFKLQQLEDIYALDNPETGSYEGNFADQVTKPAPYISATNLNTITSKAIIEGFIDKYGIILHSDWILPQIITLIGNMPLYKNTNGLYSGKQFKYQNFTTDWLKGLLLFTLLNTKSSYLKLQYKAPSKLYGALTPLVMYALRLTKGINYSSWDTEEIHFITHSDLSEAMLCKDMPAFTKEAILAYRAEGLTTALGVVKNPISTYSLTKVSDPIFTQLPKLVKIMLSQIWMAHPSNRTKYMVLDPLDWDTVPTPLIPNDVLLDTTQRGAEGVFTW